jgi:hypothetical protein
MNFFFRLVVPIAFQFVIAQLTVGRNKCVRVAATCFDI